MRVGEVEDLLGRDGDGDTVVEVSRPWHLGVDDEGGVPRVSPTLGPYQVQGLQLDVGRGDAANITLVSRVALTLLLGTLGQQLVLRLGSWEEKNCRIKLVTEK